jgi:hypothetical protein
MNGMPNAARVAPSNLLMSAVVQKVLEVLREGYDYARDLSVSPWEFAVEVPVLLTCGCTTNTLRWLSRRGYVEYGDLPAPRPCRKGRNRTATYRQHPAGPCFVLTDLGAEAARAACTPRTPAAGDILRSQPPGATGPVLPVWDGSAGELHYRGQLVKRFRKTSSNQRVVLEAFQGEGWPEQLEDPLPQDPAGSRKHRLQDTIKNLNRDHQRQLLRFYTREGGAIAWKRLA